MSLVWESIYTYLGRIKIVNNFVGVYRDQYAADSGVNAVLSRCQCGVNNVDERALRAVYRFLLCQEMTLCMVWNLEVTLA